VSIEHVLRQTVEDGSEWAKIFPDGQERSEWTHRLANLVYLARPIRSRASNRDFEEKMEYIASSDASSPFVITKGLFQTGQWTPDHLERRQAQLLDNF
jgi:hypothetical protein